MEALAIRSICDLLILYRVLQADATDHNLHALDEVLDRFGVERRFGRLVAVAAALLAVFPNAAAAARSRRVQRR